MWWLLIQNSHETREALRQIPSEGLTMTDKRITAYSIFPLTREELVAKLASDREDAAAYRGEGYMRWRSSTEIQHHNRRVRRCLDAGDISEAEADRLRIAF